jgi:hypothetical protein
VAKAAIFTMKLVADLRAQFIAAAEASHRPASQIVRELMRDFVDREQRRNTRFHAASSLSPDLRNRGRRDLDLGVDPHRS